MARATSCTASNFEVREGEVVTLLGRNGAGKTTTLKSIMGLVPRREGSIQYRGRELIDLMPNQIARSGHRLLPGGARHFRFAQRDGEPDAAAGGGARRTGHRYHLHAVPQPEGARAHGAWHKAVGRRAADAGDRADPAHRREAAAARRTDRGPGPGDRAADRPHRARDQAARLHRAAGGTELPLRTDGG